MPVSNGIGISPVHGPVMDPDLLFSWSASSPHVNTGVEGGAISWSLSSNASSKTYVDASGNLQTCAQDALRTDYSSGEAVVLLEPGATNLFLNSLTPVTQNINLSSTGAYTLSVVGSGSVEIAAGTATGSGWDTAVAGTPVTVTITGTGTVSCTVTGTPTGVQLEAGSIKTSLIPTGASAAAREDETDQEVWALTDAVKAALGSVDSPVGEELIDDVEAWTVSDNWSNDGVDAVSIASCTAENVYTNKDILTSGKTYLVSFDAVITAGTFRVRSGFAGDVKTISVSGAYSFLLEAQPPASNPARFNITSNDIGGTATFTNISVKELQPQGRLEIEWVPYASKTQVTELGANHGVVACRDATFSVLLISANGRPSTYDGANAVNNASTTYAALDLLTTVVTWDGEAESNGLDIATTMDGETETDSVDFDGAFTIEDYLRFCKNLAFTLGLKSVKLYRGVN